MKFGIVRFPGSNCERDCVDAIARILQQPTQLYDFRAQPNFADELDCLILPGGFSYGDYLRPGAIAGSAPVMSSVKRFALDGGIIVGICNGFQILCESGLLPGMLLRNAGGKFICRDVELRITNADTVLTRNQNEGEVIKLPIAHADGNYWIDDVGLARLRENSQIWLEYVNNPNGSCANIAGVTNRLKNVFGLMPHPERACEFGYRDGLKIFESICSLPKS